MEEKRLVIKKRAYAKVNLALDVLGRRENGYHDVKMVMQNLDIYDELEFEMRDMPDDGFRIIIETDNPAIPTDERNLIYKAAKLLCEEFHIQKEITVKLTKNIPVEAGMAGGSTDAAAALHAVNELAGLGLDTRQLMDYGVRLGADVPFCVLGKTALSEGIGELLTEIPSLQECVVAVAKPSVGVSTKLVYTELDSKPIEAHPDVDGMVAALRGYGDGARRQAESEATAKLHTLHKVAGLMGNVLESVTIPMHPEIAGIKRIMIENGAVNAMMSGSGPTVYGIYDTEEQAKAAIDVIREQGLAVQTFVTKPV
jgi:4-diphosphocytidyl-2-C-methyl-D-erythritol kinase